MKVFFSLRKQMLPNNFLSCHSALGSSLCWCWKELLIAEHQQYTEKKRCTDTCFNHPHQSNPIWIGFISGCKLQSFSVDFKLKLSLCLLTSTCLSSLFQHLSISNGGIQVDASFMQTLWNIQPTCSSGSMAVGKSTTCTQHTTTWLSYRFLWT